MSARRRALVPRLAVAAALAAACPAPHEPAEAPQRRPLAVAELLGGPAEAGFERALVRRAFRFPADHGPHDGFRTEWWYLTGNLEDGGDGFGYQLTFFRSALAPEVAPRASRWAASHVWMAHFAVSDLGGGEFHAGERFSREALGLAGAERAPLRVWLEDWRLSSGAGGGPPFEIEAHTDHVSLGLTLDSAKPPVLQGEAGLSRKGSRPGNASYYYSLTRMPSRGEIVLGGVRRAVTGTSWMDREWSTSALEEGQVGWDWFALQLDDGSDLMFYRLRRRGGATDPRSAGSLVDPAGVTRPLAAQDVRLEATGEWTSPDGSARYPSRWILEVPAAGLALEVEPRLADQEHRGAFRYWEGAVAASGRFGGRPVRGLGYVELTGYETAGR